jgi:glutamate dehydrogenase (NADP+)
MTELSRHIGANTDVPAGDIEEVEKLVLCFTIQDNEFTGVLTGKEFLLEVLNCPEATGFGTVYFAQSMLNTKKRFF